VSAVKALRVSEEGVQTGFGAEVDNLSMIFGSWIISRVSVENSFANCMELLSRFVLKLLICRCHSAFNLGEDVIVGVLG